MTRHTQPSGTRGGLGRHGQGPGRPLRRLATAALLLAIALPLAGCQLAGGSRSARQAPAEASGTAAKANPNAAVPTRVSIPSIDVDAEVTSVGLKPDGAMEVPGFSETGWYELGPRPGAAGPAVIVGHVDSKKGPAVFYRLRDLEPGDLVEVRDRDGNTHRFEVERSERYPKDALPVDDIWPDTDRPLLRLVTCAGAFDRSTGHYRDNLVIYAALVA